MKNQEPTKAYTIKSDNILFEAKRNLNLVETLRIRKENYCAKCAVMLLVIKGS